MKVNLQTGIARTSKLVKMASPFIEKKAAASVADYLNQRRETRFALKNPAPVKAQCPDEKPAENPLLPILSAGFLGAALGAAIGTLLAKRGTIE